jgi:hypothetical protein
LLVAEGVDVGDADDGCDGSSVDGQYCYIAIRMVSVAEKTHIPPSARTATTAIFSLPPICNDHTSDIGRIAKIKSPAQLIAEYPNVAATTIEVSRHLPVPPV